jgi:hypothetical protein
VQSGQLVAYYPFSGNANDSSGNNLNGSPNNVFSAFDRFNNPNSAYSFNGLTSYIDVPNNALLNFPNAITLNFWMKIGLFYGREQYPVSHGNWTYRWKVSITNQKIRFTVKTTTGVKDLDSETNLVIDSLYMVTCFYDGADDEIYINGQLDAFTLFSGTILPSPVDLTIGQDVPGDNNYDFDGILDDIRIYNYGLSVGKIGSFYDIPTGLTDNSNLVFPGIDILYANYPNPFNPVTTISYYMKIKSHVTLEIFNIIGERVARLVNDDVPSGFHKVTWNASNLPSGVYICSLNTGTEVLNQKLVLLK